MGLLFVMALALLTACKTTSGDSKTKNFHITEIVLKADFTGLCLLSTASCLKKARAKKLPAELRTKLTNALHHYAAAHNQLQPGAQSAYRLEVSVTGLSYENCSTSVRVLSVVTQGFVTGGQSIITSSSKLIDIDTGSVIREITNSNQKGNILGCTVTSQNDGYSKTMSKNILRRVNLLKKTPKSVEKILANVDVLQPRLQPISPLSSPGVN